MAAATRRPRLCGGSGRTLCKASPADGVHRRRVAGEGPENPRGTRWLDARAAGGLEPAGRGRPAVSQSLVRDDLRLEGVVHPATLPSPRKPAVPLHAGGGDAALYVIYLSVAHSWWSGRWCRQSNINCAARCLAGRAGFPSSGVQFNGKPWILILRGERSTRGGRMEFLRSIVLAESDHRAVKTTVHDHQAAGDVARSL